MQPTHSGDHGTPNLRSHTLHPKFFDLTSTSDVATSRAVSVFGDIGRHLSSSSPVQRESSTA
jgi:hypothetical protein